MIDTDNSTIIEIYQRGYNTSGKWTFDSKNIFEVNFERKFPRNSLTYLPRFILYFDLICKEKNDIKKIGLTQHDNYVDINIRRSEGGTTMFAITNELNNILISLAEDITGININEFTFGMINYR